MKDAESIRFIAKIFVEEAAKMMREVLDARAQMPLSVGKSPSAIKLGRETGPFPKKIPPNL